MTPQDEIPPLTDDVQLEQLLESLLGRAGRRQLWLFFLDADDRPVGPIMPTDDHPLDPRDLWVTEDLGARSVAEVFGIRFAHLMEANGFARVVLVWERRGSDTVTEADRLWATCLGRALRDEGARVRAQFVLHSRGLRQLAPDDLPGLVGDC